MTDLVSKLRSGLHKPDAIILAGVSHDQRCLEAADEIERLREMNRLLVSDKINLRSEMAGMVKIEPHLKEAD